MKHHIGNPFELLRRQKYYKKCTYANKIVLFIRNFIKYLHICYFFHIFAPEKIQCTHTLKAKSMKTPVTDVDHLAMIIVLMDDYMASWTKYEVEEVDKNPILLFGFVKHLELIGEEALAMTNEFKGKYNVPWTQLESYKNAFHWQIKAEELYNINWNPSLSGFSGTWTKLLNIFEEISK